MKWMTKMSETLVKKCRAAILAESGKPLVIDEIELPETLACGQVLVEVLYSGICGSQLGEIDAKKGEDHYLPHLLGHEASAIVRQCGPGVRYVKPGDLVVLHWRKGPGIDAAPAVYKWQGKKLNSGCVTTFNEYAVVSENRMTPVKTRIPKNVLPLFGCAITTGFGAIANDAKVGIGQSVVILGAGGVGLSMIMAASLAGAFPIIATDIYDNRLGLAAKMGATHTINSAKKDAFPAIKELLAQYGQPLGADACLDNTGKSACIAQAYELANPEGIAVCVGVPAHGDKTSIYTLPLHFGKRITGSHGGEICPEKDIPRYIRLAEAKNLDLAAMISRTVKLDEINQAIDLMRSGGIVGRCIIDMGIK